MSYSHSFVFKHLIYQLNYLITFPKKNFVIYLTFQEDGHVYRWRSPITQLEITILFSSSKVVTDESFRWPYSEVTTRILVTRLPLGKFLEEA